MRSGVLYHVMRWHMGLCTATLALVGYLLPTRQRRGKIHGISASISASLWLQASGHAMPSVCTRAAAGRRCLPACRALGMAFLLLLLGQIALAGVAAGATITGIVRDALKQPLAGAAIRLETRDGQELHRTSSDAQGRFTFTDISAGRYAVFVEREGFEVATATGTVSDEEGWSVELILASRPRLDPMVVTAPRLEDARVLTTPRAIGMPTYEITDKAIQIQPGGANNALTQVLRQAPGVTQDASSVGGIHVRNQMGNLQYRINGVALPEGTTLFGQSGGLSPRLAESVSPLTRPVRSTPSSGPSSVTSRSRTVRAPHRALPSTA